MAIKAGVGLSKDENSYNAGFEAARTALGGLEGAKADFMFAFASVSFDQKELVRGIREASENVPLVGCSTAGGITNAGPNEKSVAVMAISSDRVKFYSGLGSGIKDGAREAGSAVAREVVQKAKEPLRTFIMLPDVLTGNGSETVRGVLDVLGPHFPVVGGAAGDDFLFEKTYQYRNDEVTSGAVAGVGLTGDFAIGIGVRHGWLPIGLPMKVTKAEGAVLHELDGKPAIKIYEEYFGAETAKELEKEALARLAITYPLGMKMPGSDEMLIRDPITVDKNGSITCAAEIPVGSEVRLMIGSKEKAVEAAKEAARHLMYEFEIDHKSPKLVLMFNCIAREKLFANTAIDEINAIMNIIGIEVPLIGFYTYGEQAPLNGEIRNVEKCNSNFYNETVVIFAIGE